MTMLQIATFFTVLILTGMQQVCSSSNDDNNRGLSSDQHEALSMVDEYMTAVRKFIDKKEHLETLKTIEDYLKNVICDSRVNEQVLSEFIDNLSDYLDSMDDGKFAKRGLIQFLDDKPLTFLEEFKHRLLNKD
ncbi:Hypothetical predicted protein [Pelobates cultripes]|uniref:Uncharacterized protein n=1 Tax=Pelobates cultripes TaxID=61616 RepID=A0AAD1WTZ8_PELCU|nr:Hypothetical predicted protein [Pelobates cultripes]